MRAVLRGEGVHEINDLMCWMQNWKVAVSASLTSTHRPENQFRLSGRCC